MIKWISACIAVTACMQGIVSAHRGEDPYALWLLACVTLTMFVVLDSKPSE